MRLLPCGDQAVLLDCASLAEATGWFAALDDLDPVLGAQTVLLHGNPAELRATVAARKPKPPAAATEADEVVIAVAYDGPDLAEVAALTGLSEDEVITAHTGTAWTVGFVGFAPGFAYLTGGDPRLRVPRRDTPRPKVPAGAVGLAGDFSGIYPRSSPGGWQLIGHTDVDLFDVDRNPPALLQPGMQVRFEARP
ncbi:MAG TPA: allophanate hydrolase subunit 1 [Aeromicrobium sp.]|nr:allophanate hydrolase subunit 1 [Aeromicrobium sp.]